MKLSANEGRLTGLWATNYASIQQVRKLKICLRARKVPGPFEKRAPGPLVTALLMRLKHIQQVRVLTTLDLLNDSH